ncbi:MAG: M81 family metallopeptidase [Alphaproteobacteria bacterium]|jgi:microcystin degradation protein MlrC|nr:M81 family metallopeptidase [Rhodospirillaceae bacterium]MBT6202633.1 M81 family metallopeptidase [Rhodospirillaceae bacterium]MBT6511497.1 M81 family metallopeptidase [Rhodospirillaceae bacterium]MBT7615505.1 M81 family metallopeptidase [Rhodospirillaceae bacterium]MDG2479768.1 M81 family metallopeptidase [Alphaproteobacteria bacterium]
MKIVVAMMKHETNTFSPVPTPLARFTRGSTEVPRGEEIAKAFGGTSSGIAAFMEICGEEGWDMVTPIAANAWPSGPVEDEAFETIAGAIVAAVEEGCDAAMLDLHGAMVTQSFEDGEGELLRRIRAVAPNLPIAVGLDMHCNLYSGIVDNCTILAGYQTYPHVDTRATAERSGRILARALKGEVSPVMAWGNRPMLPHIMEQGTTSGPNLALQERCREIEASGEALMATLFTGFPHADISQAGLSVAVATDGDQTRAETLRDELLAMAWAERETFVYKIELLADSLSRAKAMDDGLVILLDHYDNAASGGTMDTMTVLSGILEAGLEDVAAFAIHDPAAVQEMIAAGVGADITLDLGGKIAMPSIGEAGTPLRVSGRVTRLTDGRFRNKGPMGTGVLMDMGPTAVIDTGKVEIVVISKHQEPNDINAFYAVGIDPWQKRYVMIKSRVHWRAGLGELAKHVVDCAGTGVCTSDYSQLTFNNVRRPIYPLDLINEPD